MKHSKKTLFQIQHHNQYGVQRITGVQRDHKLLLITNGSVNESSPEIAGILLDIVLAQELVNNIQNYINLNS
jgi:hypothetical protein